MACSTRRTRCESLDTNSLNSSGFAVQNGYDFPGEYGPVGFRRAASVRRQRDLRTPVHWTRVDAGWQVAPIVQPQSGNPVNVVTSNSTLNGVPDTVRPDVTRSDPDHRLGGPVVRHFGVRGGQRVRQSRPQRRYRPLLHQHRSVGYEDVHDGGRDSRAIASRCVRCLQPSQLRSARQRRRDSAFGKISRTRLPTGEAGLSRQIQLAAKLFFDDDSRTRSSLAWSDGARDGDGRARRRLPVCICAGTDRTNRPDDSLGSPSFPGTPALDAAIQDTLVRQTEVPVNHSAEFLESEQFPPETASLALRDYIAKKFQGRRIDLVIANASGALQFALRFRDELFPGAPIVFSAVTIRRQPCLIARPQAPTGVQPRSRVQRDGGAGAAPAPIRQTAVRDRARTCGSGYAPAGAVRVEAFRGSGRAGVHAEAQAP